jgi:hypothetical protein
MLAIVASGCGFGRDEHCDEAHERRRRSGRVRNAAAWAAAGLLLGVAATITG